MQHIQISIEANEDQQDILIAHLYQLKCSGFEQKGTQLLAYFDEETFPCDDVTKALNGFVFHTQTIKEQNWNELWESNFHPVIIDLFCGIRAHFHQPIQNVAHEIIITPKMSFGTGHHATTYMMIEQMQSLDFGKKTVFDFGTGTGLLAILAEKLGAASITAIDIDSWSVTNTKENIEKNDCRKINVVHSSLLPNEQYDIILANINKNIILQYLPTLKNCVKENGYILLSGLLTTNEQDINKACETQQLKLIKKTIKTNWLSLLFINGI